MLSNDHLFPVRHTRRDFLYMAGATAAGLALGGTGLRAAEGKSEVKFGEGKTTFKLDETWGALPDKIDDQKATYGYGCALVVDSQDRVFVTSRSTNPCVAIFDKDGKLTETWSKNFADAVGYSTDKIAATAHGLYLSKEGDTEYLYWTENVAKDAKGNKIGARVYKTDMKGKILYELGNVEKEGEKSQKFDLTNPTDVAVSANGDVYIVDGYGNQKVHRFDKNFKLIKTIGGPGKEHGKFNTCHGVWINTLKKEPEVYIADRANNRLEVYSLEMEYKRTIDGVRNPCCFYQHDGRLYVPELDARVSIFDADDKLVTTLGDGKDVKPAERAKNPAVFATPHALTVDSKGNLYVIEWLPYGRPRKFSPVG